MGHVQKGRSGPSTQGVGYQDKEFGLNLANSEKLLSHENQKDRILFTFDTLYSP